MDDDTDSTGDPEEVRKRIEAKNTAENFGVALGLTIGAASAIADRLSERQRASNQQEEPMPTDKPDETISAEEPEQESAEQLTPEELEILEQEEYNEYQAREELWQMTM